MSNAFSNVGGDYAVVHDEGKGSYTDNVPCNNYSSANSRNYKDTNSNCIGDTTHVLPGRASPDIFSWWLPEDDVSPDDRLLEHLEPLLYDQDTAKFGNVPPSTSEIQLLRLPVVSTEGSVAVGSSSHKLSNQNPGEGYGGNTDANATSTTRSFYERQRQQAAGATTTASNPSTVCINQASDYLHRCNGSVNGHFMTPTVQRDCADGKNVTGNSGFIHTTACSNGMHVKNTNENVGGFNPFGTDEALNAHNKGSCFDDFSSVENSNDMEYFQKMISSLSMFKEKYGHTNVPKLASWFLLGSWVEQIRRRKKVQGLRDRGIKVAKDLPPLCPDQTRILDAMGFKWQAPDFYENEKIIEQIKSQEGQEPCSSSPRLQSPSSEGTITVRTRNEVSSTGILNTETPPRGTFRKSMFDQEVVVPTPIPYDHNHQNDFRLQSQQQLDMGMFERLSIPEMATNGVNSGQNVDCQTTNRENHGVENYFHAGSPQYHHENSSGQSMQNLSFPNSNPLHICHLQNLSLNRDVPVTRFAHDSVQGHQPTGSSHVGNSMASQGSQTFPSFQSVLSSSHQLPFGQHPNPLSFYDPSESCSWNQSAYNYLAANGNPFDVYSCHQSVHSHPLPSTSSDHFNSYQSRPRVLCPTEVYSSHCSSRSFTVQSVRSHGNQSCDGNTASTLSFGMNGYHSQFQAVEALHNQRVQIMNKKLNPPKRETGRGKKRKYPVNDTELERETGCSTLSRASRASREENSEQIWQYHFSKLKAYFGKKGNCEVPARYDDDAKLGHWVMTQRRQYHLMKSGKRSRITQARIDQLNTLNFKWTIRKENKVQWNERFNELFEFKKANGHCLVPQRYPSNPPLGTWVNTQRRHYKLLQDGKKSCLTEERLKKLNEIGFVWSTQSSSVQDIDQDLDIARFKSFIQGDDDFLLDVT